MSLISNCPRVAFGIQKIYIYILFNTFQFSLSLFLSHFLLSPSFFPHFPFPPLFSHTFHCLPFFPHFQFPFKFHSFLFFEHTFHSLPFFLCPRVAFRIKKKNVTFHSHFQFFPNTYLFFLFAGWPS